LDYHARQGIDPSAVSLAVVVQVMVPAQASGILFTANPINGARDEIVLDAAWGLGEAIVGGVAQQAVSTITDRVGHEVSSFTDQRSVGSRLDREPRSDIHELEHNQEQN
jgi:pyruvate,water dikinase